MASTPATMLRIVSTGLQDRERLNAPRGQPSLQFYQKVLRQRTRWASYWRRVDFDNKPEFGKTAIVTLPILGELITRATLVVDLPDIYEPQAAATTATASELFPAWSWTNGIGHALCSTMEFLIGSEVIDTLDSRLQEVLDEQTGPVDHFNSKNNLIFRNPSAYTDRSYLGFEPPLPPQPQTVECVPPFWWNRGPGPQAFPIQALYKDKVQIRCSFRPVQDCVFTSTPTSATVPGPGPLPTFPGCPLVDATGTPSGYTMPTKWNFRDAYWIVEYVSLEDREAGAYRFADLQIPIEQHVLLPVVATNGSSNVRIPVEQGGLVREMTWVAQRVEAPGYNAYFLFSRDLVQLWPDALIPNWDYGDGYLRPGFSDTRSDPVAAATFWVNGKRRFEHEGGSLFRSLIPALNCRRTPLIDRYIYRYDFGFWPTGGLESKPLDEVRGFSNWDLLQRKELVLSMNIDDCSPEVWSSEASLQTTYGPGTWAPVEDLFPVTTAGFTVTLRGACPGQSPSSGLGASVFCTVDYQMLRRTPGFLNLYVRTVPNGSAALVMKTIGPTYTWIAVAGAGGYGTDIGSLRGGDAGSAVEEAWQGGNAAQTHAAIIDPGGSTTYTNDIPGYTTASNYGFQGPIYTMTAPGVIHGWRVRTTVWPPAIANYIIVNGVTTQGTWSTPVSGNPIAWYNVALVPPITVALNDMVQIVHTSLGTTRFYTCAMNGPHAITELIVSSSSLVTHGGGGGGISALNTLGVGQLDGNPMGTMPSFVEGLSSTGGNIFGDNPGGDGYTGGGSGTEAGGGGGSYVSSYVTAVSTVGAVNTADSTVVIAPLAKVSAVKPSFDIYVWLTTYNLLRINSGRGALMFAS